MKLFIATDHGALEEKNELVAFLKELGHEVTDLGTNSSESCHYPEFATSLATNVVKERARGVLLCGSGIGVSVVANKYAGITAALCRTVDDARLSREHNNSNVICFGGRVSSVADMKEMLKVWLATEFEGGRHEIRTNMFSELGTKIS
jgi:ribose 5-phosphate isomerase B